MRALPSLARVVAILGRTPHRGDSWAHRGSSAPGAWLGVSRPRVRFLSVFAGLTLAAALMFGAAPALAEVGHPYLCQITGTSPGSASECNSGGSATPSGLSDPWGITISNGNLWVASQGNSTVDEYDSAGAFVSQQTGDGADFSGSYIRGVAVDDSTQTLYVADSGPVVVDVFNNMGAFVAKWTGSTTPSGSFSNGYDSVAVDNSTGPSSGDVYVTDSGHELIDKLDPSGNPVNFTGSASYISGPQITGTPSGPFSFNSNTSDALAVDSHGNIYVADNGNDVVDEFELGTFVQSFTGSATPNGSFASVVAVGVDSAGDVYVVDEGNDAVDEFSSSGAFIGQLTGAATPAGSFVPQGVAIDSSGDVYVSDLADSVVDKFGPAVTLPTPTTDAASSIAPTTATLNGSVDPAGGGNVTACEFDYGTSSSSLTQTQSCSPATPYSSATAVTANLTGLTADTTYYFRVAATNANGTSVGTTLSFTTTGPATVDSETATNVEATSLTLNAQINPHGFATTCEFQYGTSDTPYSTTVPCPTGLGSGTSDVTTSINVTGLSAGTTYHFDVVAMSSQGTIDGTDQTVTTAPPAWIDSETATNITSTGATLNAEINPEGLDTTCFFQYGTSSTPYSNTVPCPADLGSGGSDVATSVTITGLTPNTLYHFNVVAHNSLGTENGGDTTFTTLPAVSIDSESASGVTNSEATLKAQINPEGTDTTAQFQYVPDSSFVSSGFSDATTVPVPATDLGSGLSDVATSVDLTGLTPGTKYDYRVVATNSLVPSGDDGNTKTFTTLGSLGAAGLPDSRAYEMVSPVNKGGEPFANSILAGDQAASDGNSVGYVALSPFPGGAGPSINDLATRTSTGWVSTPILPEQAPGMTLELPGFGLYSSDLSKGILGDGGGTVGADSGSGLPGVGSGELYDPAVPDAAGGSDDAVHR